MKSVKMTGFVFRGFQNKPLYNWVVFHPPRETANNQGPQLVTAQLTPRVAFRFLGSIKGHMAWGILDMRSFLEIIYIWIVSEATTT